MKVCCVCDKENSSYKCPKCRQFYCSAICCKSHKESGCEEPQLELPATEPTIPEKLYEFPGEDTVPQEKLQLLRGSDKVKACLTNPHVRDIVTAILKDKDPTRAIGLAMTEPIFVELADACLEIVESPDEKKPC